jgi:hypothetical protein
MIWILIVKAVDLRKRAFLDEFKRIMNEKCEFIFCFLFPFSSKRKRDWVNEKQINQHKLCFFFRWWLRWMKCSETSWDSVEWIEMSWETTWRSNEGLFECFSIINTIFFNTIKWDWNHLCSWEVLIHLEGSSILDLYCCTFCYLKNSLFTIFLKMNEW